MLAHASTNLLTMLARFEPGEVVRVATDSLYVQKKALWRLEEVEAYVPPGCWEEKIEKALEKESAKGIIQPRF